MRILTGADLYTLARLCVAEETVQLARGHLETEGWTVGRGAEMKRSPWQVTLERASAEARQLAATLGLSPSARGRLDVEPKTPQPEENDYEAFLAEGRRIRAEGPPPGYWRRGPRS
jgi:P27 family predicted phage terminase small subunit